MKRHTHTIFWLSIITAFFAVLPTSTYAAEMSIQTSAPEPYTGDEIVISVLAHSTETLNAVEGTLLYPKDKLHLKEIRDGDSVIHFWIQKEAVEDGVVAFSGIAAGGFSGASSNLISLVFTAKEPGDALVTLTDASLLLNDGSGVNALTSIRNNMLTINPGKDNVEQQHLADTELPEYFTPELVSDPSLFDGAYAVVFATQDKGSGMSHYKIREGRFGVFVEAESPYLLRNQELQKSIYIKAVDVYGNERLVVLPATNPVPLWHYIVYTLITLIVITVILYVTKNLWHRRR